MKLSYLLTLALGVSVCATLAHAQSQHRGPGGPPGCGHPPAPPIVAALDTNTNGVIDATEIANAATALLALDKNSDGKLIADELMPAPPGRTNQSRCTPPPGARRPACPLLTALDADGNGELDANEIANASTALSKLDANGDGKLTRDELRPKDAGPSCGRGAPGPGGSEGFDGPPDGPPDGPEGFDQPPDGPPDVPPGE